MKAPDAFCVDTVPRTHASSTFTVVCAQAVGVRVSKAVTSSVFMGTPVKKWVKRGEIEREKARSLWKKGV
jgi:hypothetical protein